MFEVAAECVMVSLHLFHPAKTAKYLQTDRIHGIACLLFFIYSDEIGFCVLIAFGLKRV